MKTHIIHVAEMYSVLVMVQFHPWIKFFFVSNALSYMHITIPKNKGK